MSEVQIVDNLFEIVSKMDAITRFKYVVVVIVCINLLSRINMGINIIVALVIAYLLIKYMNDKMLHSNRLKKNNVETKANIIKPALIDYDQYHDLVDFFFSIQDLSQYNPQAYEEMINNVNSFLVIYDETKNITRLCEDKYQIAEQKVYNAVNALHSIIHSLENQILEFCESDVMDLNIFDK